MHQLRSWLCQGETLFFNHIKYLFCSVIQIGSLSSWTIRSTAGLLLRLFLCIFQCCVIWNNKATSSYTPQHLHLWTSLFYDFKAEFLTENTSISNLSGAGFCLQVLQNGIFKGQSCHTKEKLLDVLPFKSIVVTVTCCNRLIILIMDIATTRWSTCVFLSFLECTCFWGQRPELSVHFCSNVYSIPLCSLALFCRLHIKTAGSL